MNESVKMLSIVESSDDFSSAAIDSSSDCTSEYQELSKSFCLKPDENKNQPQSHCGFTWQKLSVSELVTMLLADESYDFDDESTSCMFCVSHVQQAYQVAKLFQSPRTKTNDDCNNNSESPLKFFYEATGDDTLIMITASKLHTILNHQQCQPDSQLEELQVQHSTSSLNETSTYSTFDNDNKNLFTGLSDMIDTSLFCKTEFFVQDSMPLSPVNQVSVRNPLAEPLLEVNVDNNEYSQSYLPKSDMLDQEPQWTPKTEVYLSQPDKPESSSNIFSTSAHTLKDPLSLEGTFIPEAEKSKKGWPTKCNCPNCSVKGGPNDTPQYVCHIPGCGKVLTRVRYLKVHLQWHSGKVNFVCAYCEAGFMYKTSLRNHIIKHMIGFNIQNQRKCQTSNCIADGGSKTKRPYGKLQHVCHIAGCGRVFRHVGHFNRHIDWHNEKKTFFCARCNEGFVLKSELNLHAQTHVNSQQSDSVGSPILQNYYSLESPPSPKIKTEILPYNVRPRQACHISGCERFYYSTRSLREHLMSDHLVKPYKCTRPSCGKTFLYKYNFLLHEKNHGVEKKFICPHCGERFRRILNLNIHVCGKHKNLKFVSIE